MMETDASTPAALDGAASAGAAPTPDASAYTMAFLLAETGRRGGSDLHFTVDAPPLARIGGQLLPLGEARLSPEDTDRLAREILSPRDMDDLQRNLSADLAISMAGAGRFRINAYFQRGSISIALRRLSDDILTLEELGVPPVVGQLSRLRDGMVLVTGATGSGKSTTLATLIDMVNSTTRCNIITIEDPIEYVHRNKQSIVNQREMHTDVDSFANALRAALRADPDVILVGEMRDLDTIRIAIMAAETGHLVFSTLHSRDAVSSVNRIIGVFSSVEQDQVRQQLSSALKGVVSQQLLPRMDGKGRVLALEIMIVNPAVGNLIRIGKTAQIYSMIETSFKEGMQTMEQSLLKLHKAGLIDRDTVLRNGKNPQALKQRLG